MRSYKLLSGVFLFFSFLGFLDALYLTVQHYAQQPVICSILEGCNIVLTSPYATILGDLPNALFGIFYYGVLFLLALFFIGSGTFKYLKIAGYITILGLITHLYFLYLQVYIIGAFCIYCLSSAAITLILFLIGLFFISKKDLRITIYDPSLSSRTPARNA